MDAREHEVRRRMDAHELYTDSGDGLEALEEERIRGKELAHAYNATGPGGCSADGVRGPLSPLSPRGGMAPLLGPSSCL